MHRPKDWIWLTLVLGFGKYLTSQNMLENTGPFNPYVLSPSSAAHIFPV